MFQHGRMRKKILPSQPLHMTTRAAASKTGSVATGSSPGSIDAQSVAISVASDESRRNSIREATSNVGGSDIDSNRPLKAARMSLRSSRGTSGSISSESKDTGPINGEESGSRKSSLAENSTAGNTQINNVGETATGPVFQNPYFDNAPTAPQAQFVRRSPVKRGGRGSRSLRGALMVGSTVRIDSPGAPNRMLDGDLTDHQSPGRNDPGGVLERLPGRKRAQHPDPEVEVALRRQLELKVAYRAVAKALKPVLAELAQRTAQELQEDVELHMRYPEYDDMIRELEDRLQKRLQFLDAQLREEKDRRHRMKVAYDEMVNSRFDVSALPQLK